jgi:hypothetical protein
MYEHGHGAPLSCIEAVRVADRLQTEDMLRHKQGYELFLPWLKRAYQEQGIFELVPRASNQGDLVRMSTSGKCSKWQRSASS